MPVESLFLSLSQSPQWSVGQGVLANTWLQSACRAFNIGFIDNFNLFWGCSFFFRSYGLHPCTLGSNMLAATCCTTHLLTHCWHKCTRTLCASLTFTLPFLHYTRPPFLCPGGTEQHPHHQIQNFTNYTQGCFRPNCVFNFLLERHDERTFSTDIKMAVLNVCSLWNKSFIINDVILDNNLDSILLTETCLALTHLLFSLMLPHQILTFYFLPEGAKKEAELHQSLKTPCCQIKSFFNKYLSFEYHAFVLSSPPILCMKAYRPPRYSTSSNSEFSELLSITHSNYNRILITGDFNLHLDNSSDTMSREFLNLLHCLDFN